MPEQTEFYAPERVLIVTAHADDIEFGMAGTVARWTESGTRVSYCIVTDNSSGSNEPGADLGALIQLRQEEQMAAAKVVSVSDVRFLGYRDGILQPTLELRRDITRIIRELRPQIVATFDPTTVLSPQNNYINHPDHRAAGEAALYAAFPSAETRPIFPELLAEGYEPHRVERVYLYFSLEPTLYVDVTAVHEKKTAALLCHRSQVSEDVAHFVDEMDSQLGQEIDVPFAESFRVLNLRENEPGGGSSQAESG